MSNTSVPTANSTSPPAFDFSFLYQPEPWQNQRPSILGITIAALTLSWICVLSRLYIRFKVVHSPGWDDFFIGLFLSTATVGSIAICLATNYGLGQHLLLLKAPQVRMFLMVFYVANASYISSTTFIKLSLLFQYIRIYEHGTAIRRFCIFLIGLVALWGAAFSFMAWAPCFPVHRYWDFLQQDGKCYGFGVTADRTTFLAHTASNMGFDLFILAIPVPLFFEKNTLLKTRIGMVALLLLGCLVNTFAAWRLVALVQQSESRRATVFDSTFDAPNPILLSILEVSLASVCASVPIFWPILSQRFFGRIFVTREVEVTREDRYKLGDDAASRDGSEVELRTRPPYGPAMRYRDEFIADLVDPFRPHTTETSVTSESVFDKRRRRQRGF